MKYYLLQLFHNSVVHFAMGLCCRCPDWLIRLHDWSAKLAWPEVADHPVNPEVNDLRPGESK